MHGPARDEDVRLHCIHTGVVPMDSISSHWVERHAKTDQWSKRFVDVVIAGTSIILLLPLMVAIAAAIRLSSDGPALFRQYRLGRQLRPFRIYKFRTMRVEHSDEAGVAGFAGAGDPRVTGVGRHLRNWHLDELPQLINIVRGEMSLVGPRPEPLDFARRMAVQVPLYEQRYLIRPGLTGYAQIRQGYAMDTVAATRVKLSFDIFYICHRSIWMDFGIMLRTPLHLLRLGSS